MSIHSKLLTKMDVKALKNSQFLLYQKRKGFNKVRSGFHVIVFCFHALVLLCGFARIDLDACNDPFVEAVKPYKFLTISGWCYALQIVHLWLSIQIEWMEYRGLPEAQLLQKKAFRDYMFRSFMMPSTLLVCVLFWSLCLIDRNLVYPPAWDQLVPSWMNHTVHSFTAVVTCLELIMQRTSGVGRKVEVFSYWCFSGGYAIMMWIIYHTKGVWFYPFLEMFTWYQYIIFHILFCLSGHLLVTLVRNFDERRMAADKSH